MSHSFGHYVKEAFKVKVPVPGMGGMPVNILAVTAIGILGFALPPIWLLGLGLETAYLVSLASNSRFQNFVNGKHILASQVESQRKHNQLVEKLEGESFHQYNELLEKIQIIHEKQQDPHQGNNQLQLPGLSQLLWTFLQLLLNRQSIQQTLDRVKIYEIKQEISDTEKRIQEVADNAALTRSLQGTLDLANKRLENLAKAKSNLQLIDAEILRMEQQVDLLLEETALMKNPELLSARLDGVIHSISTTSQWLKDNPELEYSLSESEPPLILSTPEKAERA